MNKFVFSTSVTIKISENIDGDLVRQLWHNFTYTASSAEVTTIEGDNILIIENGKIPILTSGEYAVNISEVGVCIKGRSCADVMHGYFDVLDAVVPDELEEGKEKLSLECKNFEKSADIAFRSVHLCILPETTLDSLKKCILAAGATKMTHIVLETWGMIKLDALKELAWQSAYEKEDIRKLVKLANSLGMKVIPMLNQLGHASSARHIYGKHVVLDQNPRLVNLFTDNGWVWNIKSDKVRKLHTAIRNELIELCGDAEYFHLGFDEVYSFDESVERTNEFIDYINEIAADLKTHGRRAIIWGDMLLNKKKFEEFYKENGIFAHPIAANNINEDIAKLFAEKLDKSIVIGDWQYYTKGDFVWETSRYFKSCGFDVMCCPWDLEPWYKNIDGAVNTVKDGGLLGIMHTTWHTLKNGFHCMVYAGLVSFDNTVKFPTHSEAMTYAASLQRRLAPSYGNYEKSGWSQYQIEV